MGPCFRASRWLRSPPSEMSLAVPIIFSMGRKDSQAISQPPPTAISSRPGTMLSVRIRMVCIRPERSVAETTPRIQMPVTSMST